MNIDNLHFFDSNGYELNFEQNSDGFWEGSIYLPKVSVGLYTNTSIYVLEKLDPSEFSYSNEYFSDVVNQINTSKFNNEYFFPIGDGKIKFTWDPLNTFVDEFFMFDFDESYTLKETSSLTYTPNDGPECNTLLINTFDTYEIPLDNTLNSKALPIHIAFMANERYDATTYNRTLIMSYKGQTVAKIKFYTETVEEDERLKIWNANLGYNITPEDEMLFYKSDIKEYKPDYILLNEKRKELMMEGSNIYPYIGSYKAIINAIKFFGYNNLNIIEYWRNVNPDDENFGKIYHSSKYSLTNKETLRIGARTITLPNKDYKKINSLALVYSINKPLKERNEMDLPLVKEQFTYTIEEALIKLFGLRKKLNKEFMPGTSRIIDIIGEANYFVSYGITKIHNSSCILPSEKRYTADFEVTPGKYLHITGDDEQEEYYAYVTIKNTSFDPVTFENCELKFNCIDNPLCLLNSESSEIKMGDNSLSFGNIDQLGKPESITWDIKMSDDQLDEDLIKVDIEKYYKKDSFAPHSSFDYGSQGYTERTFELPFIGYYDVTLTLNYSNLPEPIKKTKKKCIKVEPYNISLLGFYYDARNLPESLKYDMDDKLRNFIQEHINYLTDNAKDERPENNTESQFSMPKGTNPGPYFNDNIDNNWIISDNINFDIAQLKPIVDYTRYIKNGVDVKPFTWFLLTYDYGKIVGVKDEDRVWTIINNSAEEGDTKTWTWTGQYLTFLLKKEGNYTIKLTLTDKNGNVYEVSRNIIVVSKSADYKLYQTFKREYDYMIQQDELNALNEYYLIDREETE